MSVQSFKLTLRPDDLLELYPESKGFVTFWRRRRAHIMVAILMIGGIVVNLVSRRADSYSLALILATALLIVPLMRALAIFIRNRKAILLWVEDSRKYKQHSVELSDTGFTYLRDDERFETAFSIVMEVIQTSDYVYIQHGRDNIIFPSKAFDPGEYERFVTEFKKRRKAATTTQ